MRLRKMDHELLAEVDRILSDGFWDDPEERSHNKMRKAWSSFYERVLADEAKAKDKTEAGFPVRRAVDVIKGVLGRRCIVPQNPGRTWFIPLQNRINASGLNEELIRKAAVIAGKEWRGAIRAEAVIRGADKLLSEFTEDTAPLDTRPGAQHYLEDL